MLMQLNESTARIDAQLEQVTRKIEKIEFDTRGDQEQSNLTYRSLHDGKGSKSPVEYSLVVQSCGDFSLNPLITSVCCDIVRC